LFVVLFVCYHIIVGLVPVPVLERLISKMTSYVWSGTYIILLIIIIVVVVIIIVIFLKCHKVVTSEALTLTVVNLFDIG